jgi:hypothetical protein
VSTQQQQYTTRETKKKKKSIPQKPLIKMSPAQAATVLFLLCFFSSAHAMTSNCTNKNTPSSSCCSGEITLDPTMTTISSSAFYGCSNLTGSLTIPPSVTSIGNGAFNGCSGLSGWC